MRKVFTTYFFAIIFLTNSLEGQTSPAELRENKIKHLEEHTIVYSPRKEEELYSGKVKYRYDRKKEELQIVKDENSLINIRWIKKDSLIERYEYHKSLDGSQPDIHELQEIRFEDKLMITKIKFLPLFNNDNYNGLEYVPIEDVGIGQVDSLRIDNSLILSKIPLKIVDTIDLFQIRVELSDPQNNISKLRGVYVGSSLGKKEYDLKHIELTKDHGNDLHIKYTYVYKKYKNDFQIVSKIGFNRHSHRVKFFGLDDFSVDEEIERRYKYDSRGNWVEMKVFRQGKLNELINRKIKYYKRNKT